MAASRAFIEAQRLAVHPKQTPDFVIGEEEQQLTQPDR